MLKFTNHRAKICLFKKRAYCLPYKVNQPLRIGDCLSLFQSRCFIGIFYYGNHPKQIQGFYFLELHSQAHL